MMCKDTYEYIKDIGGSRELSCLLDFMRDHKVKPSLVVQILSEDKNKRTQIETNRTLQLLMKDMNKAAFKLGIIENGTKEY